MPSLPLILHRLRRVNELSRQSYTYKVLLFFTRMWTERLTVPGRWFVVASLASGLAGSFPEVMTGSYAFSAFTSLLLLSLFVSIIRPPRVRVERAIPPRCAAGSTFPLRVTIANQTRHAMADVGAYEFRLPPQLVAPERVQYVATLPAGASHTFEYAVRADKRGLYTLPGPTALSPFPFGLTQSRVHREQPARLIVYPRFTPLNRLDVPVGKRYQPGGIVLTSHVGESMEFIGNREYRPGDRLRDLHPRSWARVGYPVVRQFQEEFLTRVAILVDTYVPPSGLGLLRRKGEEDALEANLSLAAAISDYLARQEYIVDLFAAGPELYHFQAGRSLGYLDNILDILACIDRCPTDPLDTVGPRFSEELGQISTVITLLLDWEPRRQALLQRIVQAGVEVKPILVSDRHTISDFASAGSGARCVTPAQVHAGVEEL